MKDFREILANQRQELEATDFSGFVRRKEEAAIDLDSKLAQIVIGVRRCGKSTICQRRLLESGRNFAYINFDDENLGNLKAEELNDVMDALYKINGDFTHLFIDEVQNAPSWPLFVNRILRQGLHVVITGSNANLLGGELATHLTGRYNQIELLPFSFAEYCNAKQVDTVSLSTKANAFRYTALEQYIKTGGFPEMINEAQPVMYNYAMSLLNAVISKDIARRYKIKYKATLNDIASGLIDKFCQEISASSVAKTHGLKSVHTAANYIQYVLEAYLMVAVPSFSYKSAERQQKKKLYVIDNAFVDSHKDTLQPENLGWRLENVVALELKRRINPDYQGLYYIRKNKDFEVDFAITERSHVNQLIQVTYNFQNPTTKLYNREIGGLVKASRTTMCDDLTLVVMDGNNEVLSVDGKQIKIVRATDWLLSEIK